MSKAGYESAKEYTIVHNGYKIQRVRTSKEVDEYIKSVLAPHMDLNPKKIMDKTIKNNEYGKTRIIRYRYYTLYEENFLIDYMENCEWH